MDDDPAPYVPDEQEARSSRLRAAFLDFGKAKDACHQHSLHVKDLRDDLHEVIVDAIVVRYARAFVQAKGWGISGKPLLDRTIYPEVAEGDPFDDPPQEGPGITTGHFGILVRWREMHDHLVDTMRHQSIGHSDAVQRAPWLLRAPEERDALQSFDFVTLMPEDVSVVEAMCDYAAERVRHMIDGPAESGD